MTDLRRELGRKAFHMLSLVYLAGYWLVGWPAAWRWMAGITLFALALETARLRIRALDAALSAPFEGMIRDAERRRFSGIVYTSAGCLIAMLVAQGDARIVNAAILQLAFADAAAALVGKAWGRTPLLGGPKTVEGTAAGLAAGAVCALVAGAPALPAAASALAASAAELKRNDGWINDNLLIPLASALVLRLLLP